MSDVDREWLQSEGAQQHLRRLLTQREQLLVELVGAARESTDPKVRGKATAHWVIDRVIEEMTSARS